MIGRNNTYIALENRKMQRRTKLRIPSPSNLDEEVEGLPATVQKKRPVKRNKIKIGSTYDEAEEEEEGGNDELELKLKNRRKKGLTTHLPKIDNADDYNNNIDDNEEKQAMRGKESTDGGYKELFLKQTKERKNLVESTAGKVQIMTLEDMEDMDDEEDFREDSVPSRREIEEIKKRKVIMKQKGGALGTGFYDTGKQARDIEYNEKEYVKLLDQDDKLELMEIVGHTRGDEDENAKEFGTTMNEFEDEKLALTGKEKRMEQIQRRLEIEQALMDTHDAEWENQQLNKVGVEASHTANLPALAEIDSTETLQDMIAELERLRVVTCAKSKHLTIELKNIAEQRQSLYERREAIQRQLGSILS